MKLVNWGSPVQKAGTFQPLSAPGGEGSGKLRTFTGVQAISAGESHSLFLKSDGSAWGTGDNDFGKYGLGGNILERYSPIPVRTQGENPSDVQAFTDVRNIVAGGSHSLFLKTDGSVWAAGSNGKGQFGGRGVGYSRIPLEVVAGVQAIAAGSLHSLFLKTDGSVWAAGDNSRGQLGDGTTNGRSTAVQILTDVQSISAGRSHSLFLKNDGTVWATGYNNRGQLGDGTTENRRSPVRVLTGVRAISAGYSHSMFLKADGSVWATGYNLLGQMGDGTTDDHSTPVPILTEVQAISAGSTHSLFLKTNGSAWAAGYNPDGQLGLESVNKSIPVLVMQLGINQISLWQQEQFGADADNPAIAAWGADPDRDGVVNLLERACNLPPLQAGIPSSGATPGTAGLPWITTLRKPEGLVLALHYLRLKGTAATGLTYTPEFSSAPGEDGGWSAAAGPETVESLDANWDRVVVMDVSAGSATSRFARVRVTVAP